MPSPLGVAGGVAVAALGVVGVVAWMTRGITFVGTNTDTGKMVQQAARFRLRGWLSAMHRLPGGRAQGREYWVFFLTIMQRCLRDRTSEAANVWLGLVSHGASAVLIYGVASRYWSSPAGLLVAALYLGSFWPVQTAIYVGHVLLSQLFLLLAVAATQAAASVPPPAAWGWDAVSGLAAAVSFFSSSSSRKYLPVFLGAFGVRHLASLGWPSAPGGPPLLAAGLGGLAAVLAVSSRPLARFLYRRRASRGVRLALGQLAAGRDLGDFTRWAATGTRVASGGLAAAALYLGATGWVVTSSAFYPSHLCLLLGAGLVLLHVMLPNLVENLARFRLWFNASTWAGRFPLYQGYFAQIGWPIPNGMRGAGLPWLVRFFLHQIPLVAVLWGASLALVVGRLALGPSARSDWVAAAGLVGLSLAPLLTAEWTRCAQAARPYFPCLVGFLILIAAAGHQVDQALIGQPVRLVWWTALAALLGGSLCWNVWVFVTDVWPARMAPAWLGRALRQLGVTGFATYDTPYNEAFVNALPPEELARYEIRFIRSLADVASGIVVVPGTSAKTLTMDCWAMSQGDFDGDPALTELLRSQRITRCALRSFQTLGTSRVFPHESDVLSYRSLILREITPQDRWRARGWILDGAALARERCRPADVVPEPQGAA